MPTSKLACRSHWYSIPKPLRDELWRAWLEDGALTEAHIAAMKACTDYLEKAAA